MGATQASKLSFLLWNRLKRRSIARALGFSCFGIGPLVTFLFQPPAASPPSPSRKLSACRPFKYFVQSYPSTAVNCSQAAKYSQILLRTRFTKLLIENLMYLGTAQSQPAGWELVHQVSRNHCAPSIFSPSILGKSGTERHSRSDGQGRMEQDRAG